MYAHFVETLCLPCAICLCLSQSKTVHNNPLTLSSLKYALCSLQLWVTEALTEDTQQAKWYMQCNLQYCVSLQHNTYCIMLFRHQLHWSSFLMNFHFRVNVVQRDKNSYIFSKTSHNNWVNHVIITKSLDISLHFHIHVQCSVHHSGVCQGALSPGGKGHSMILIAYLYLMPS